jgi:hypothetical protein
MPQLRAISITLYVVVDTRCLKPHPRPPELVDLEAWLPSLLPLEKLEQLYVVQTYHHKPERLLVH